MAYVLGFFAADGCLTINPRGAKYLDFTSCDRDVLVKIRRLMRSGHKISNYRSKRPGIWKDKFRLQIGSKYIFSHLVALGFMVNKSLTIQFPSVPDPFLLHFVRGYFDGDGFIVRRKGCWDLRFATKDTAHLCKWMYKDHHGLYLNRKYQVYKKIFGDVE